MVGRANFCELSWRPRRSVQRSIEGPDQTDRRNLRCGQFDGRARHDTSEATDWSYPSGSVQIGAGGEAATQEEECRWLEPGASETRTSVRRGRPVDVATRLAESGPGIPL